MHADEHAGAMYMTMTIVRPGLFFQREGPGSEPGNTLVCPDEAACSVCGVLGMNQCRASKLHKQHEAHSRLRNVRRKAALVEEAREGELASSPRSRNALMASRTACSPYCEQNGASFHVACWGGDAIEGWGGGFVGYYYVVGTFGTRKETSDRFMAVRMCPLFDTVTRSRCYKPDRRLGEIGRASHAPQGFL